MLSQVSHREVSSYGVQATNAFSIKANGKAFKVLIDGLYSDKIRAVIRELWTNAFDSHVMAGKADVPFDCHLPTFGNPTFVVRDYGVSLTDDGVMRLYTTVFESSKEDTNTQVGKLGLGSKSPFAYTDTFTVTAWLDGRKRTYSAYIGADYVPQIARMSDEPSDEPQGFAVSFPAKSDDLYAFASSAADIARGFTTHPNIDSRNYTRRVDPVVSSGDGWVLYKSSDWGRKAEARQGCVLYPLSASAVPNLTETQRELLNSPLIIDFPIGDLEISASREGLGYDATTVTNIRNRLNAIEADIIASFEKTLSSAQTFWDFAAAQRDIEMQNVPDSFKKLAKRTLFRGRKLTDGVIRVEKSVFRDTPVISLDYHKLRQGVQPRLNVASSDYFNVVPGMTLVYVQSKSVPVPYATARIADHFMKLTQPIPTRVFYMRCERNSTAFRRIYAAMGRPDMKTFVWVDDLPKPQVTRGSAARASIKAKILVNAHTLTDADVTAEDGGYYLPMNYGEFVDMMKYTELPKGRAHYTISQHSAYQIVSALRQLNLLPASAPVYAVPATLKALTEDASWVSVWDVVKPALATVDPVKAAEWAGINHMLSNKSGVLETVMAWRKAAVKFAAGGVMAEAIDALTPIVETRNALQDYKHYEMLVSFCYPYQHAARVVYDTTSNAALVSLIDRVNVAYPLLKYAFNHETTSNYTLNGAAIMYVNMVDTQTKLDNVRKAA